LPHRHLTSLVFSGYRSFGPKLQRFSQFGQINILIGQNNCGKSNVLRFLNDWLATFDRHQRPPLGDHDRHIPNRPGIVFGRRTVCGSRGRVDDTLVQQLFNVQAAPYVHPTLRTVLQNKMQLDDDQEGVWFCSDESGVLQLEEWKSAFTDVPNDALSRLWQHLTKQSGGDRHKHWIPETVRGLAPKTAGFPCHLIPAIRKVGAGGTTSGGFSGEGIIERLAKLQNPPALEQEAKATFKKIGDFLRTVTDNQSAEIEIPYARDTILVRMDGKTLPLDSLGSGLHEVIILAAAATVLDNCVVCMEEPELHLNPILQKKLVRYLQEATSNQYFITTHSAALMDTPDAEVYHVTMSDGASRVERVTSDRQRSSICEDLGYHPSDLLQTNCIIWVEGPSDRTYLNWWIQSTDAGLIEGIHYSIMFYGGRLACHVSGDDEAHQVDEFISLRRLNRRGVIVIDSDRAAKRGKINETKSRLRDEFDRGPGHAWITSGREIENYIDPKLVSAAISATHPTYKLTNSLEAYDNVLSVANRKGEPVQASKVKVALEVVKSGGPDFARLDLRDRVRDLIRFIRESNPRVSTGSS
jgi:AAA ATPase domain